MLSAWRLLKTKHLAHAWTGEGARLYGGRWNNPGVRVIYTSENLSLAVLEVLVHLQRSAVLPAYSAIHARFPEALVEELKLSHLPTNWRASPAPADTQSIGDQWIAEGRSAVLQVPSVVVAGEFNYLMNPEHKDFGRVKHDTPVAFPFDKRLG